MGLLEPDAGHDHRLVTGVNLLRMTDLDLAARRVLIREDLNVPVAEGRVTSDARIRAALPTLRLAIERGARVLVMSHLGRPKEGARDPALSLAPVAARLSELLGRPVRLVDDWLDGVDVTPGEVVLLENVRFNKGEKADDEALARRIAALCDVFVMDAFGTAHRAEASTHGVARFAPIACAGPLLVSELEALETALGNPARPLLAVVGGSKVSTKLKVLQSLSAKVDELIGTLETQCGEGTRVLAQAIARSKAFSIAGGGDTLAAIDKYGVGEDISYISTGGGAFLEFVEGRTLPAVAVLEQRSRG